MWSLALLLAAASVTFDLAFGLGGREVARALSAGRYIRGSYRVGQRISVGNVGGEITAIESAFTVLATDGARRVRVPDDLFLGSIVTIHAPADPEDGGGPEDHPGAAPGPGDDSPPEASPPSAVQ